MKAQRAFVTTGLKLARESVTRRVFDRFPNVCDCWKALALAPCQRAARLGGITRRSRARGCRQCMPKLPVRETRARLAQQRSSNTPKRHIELADDAPAAFRIALTRCTHDAALLHRCPAGTPREPPRNVVIEDAIPRRRDQRPAAHGRRLEQNDNNTLRRRAVPRRLPA